MNFTMKRPRQATLPLVSIPKAIVNVSDYPTLAECKAAKSLVRSRRIQKLCSPFGKMKYEKDFGSERKVGASESSTCSVEKKSNTFSNTRKVFSASSKIPIHPSSTRLEVMVFFRSGFWMN